MCRSSKVEVRKQVMDVGSLLPLYGPKIKLRSLDLALSTITHWAIVLAPFYVTLIYSFLKSVELYKFIR